MGYDEILRLLAIKENISEKELEREMQAAINSTGLNCSVNEFIRITSELLKERLYIV